MSGPDRIMFLSDGSVYTSHNSSLVSGYNSLVLGSYSLVFWSSAGDHYESDVQVFQVQVLVRILLNYRY